MAHRSFDSPAALAPDPSLVGPSFDLAGETFRCVPECPSGVMARMVSAVSTNERGDMVYNAIDILAFFYGVLVDREWKPTGEGDEVELVEADDVARFKALAFSKTIIITIEQLAEVFLWLCKEYTGGRPTAPPRR